MDGADLLTNTSRRWDQFSLSLLLERKGHRKREKRERKKDGGGEYLPSYGGTKYHQSVSSSYRSSCSEKKATKNTVFGLFLLVKFCKLFKSWYVSFDGVRRSEMFELVKRYKKILKWKCSCQKHYFSNISYEPLAAMQLVQCPSKAEEKAALVLSKH